LSKFGHRLRQGARQVHRIIEFTIGIAFMVMAAGAISLSFTEWHKHVENPSAGLSQFYMFVSFSVVLVFCCLYSFLKARSIR
jgi:TRAP-type C4-dicarboxylate transport system permease small subunit